MVRAAWMYYEERRTQQEIATLLGVSRVKVVRLLQAALRDGIVQITVCSPLTAHLALGRDLRERYGLTEAVVAPEADEGEPLYSALAQAAARALVEHLRPGMRVGLGFGRTVCYLPRFFRPSHKVACTFMPLAGGPTRDPYPEDPFSLCRVLAEMAGGQAVYIYAPAAVSSPGIRASLLQDDAIRQSLELARTCDLALLSVGPAVDKGLLYLGGLLTEMDLADVERKGAVGEALGRFFDGEGREIPTGLATRMIAIDLSDLKAIPTTVIVAGGERKRCAIRGLLRGGIADVLVTDAGTARWLVSEARGSGVEKGT